MGKACWVKDVTAAVETKASCFVGLCGERWRLSTPPSYLSSLEALSRLSRRAITPLSLAAGSSWLSEDEIWELSDGGNARQHLMSDSCSGGGCDGVLRTVTTLLVCWFERICFAETKFSLKTGGLKNQDILVCVPSSTIWHFSIILYSDITDLHGIDGTVEVFTLEFP